MVLADYISSFGNNLLCLLGAEATQKRFWNDVGVERREEALVVTLDKRALKTPGGKTLELPLNKSLPAALIAAEWDHQETLLKPHALPMVCPEVLAHHVSLLFRGHQDFDCLKGSRRNERRYHKTTGP